MSWNQEIGFASMFAILLTITLVACHAHEVDHRLAHNHHHHHHHDETLSPLSGAHEDSHGEEEKLVQPDPVDLGKPLHGHHCIHDQVAMKREDMINAPQRYVNRSSQRGYHEQTVVFNNIRIQYFFDVDNLGHCATNGSQVNSHQNGNTMTTCTGDDILTDMKLDYIMNTLMPAAVSFLSGALGLVTPVNGSLAVQSSCNGITIPSSHTSPGVANADFVVYITAVPLAASSNAMTVAWATACQVDGANHNRPVAGQVNFVPRALSNANVRKEYVTAQDTNTAIHELSHALGFTSSYFNDYMDMNGAFFTSGTTSGTDATLGKTVTKMVSPRVVAAAKKYFGCTTMTGVEIEDQGGSGTQGSHWEKRILYNEYIAGVLSTVKTYISSISLAYFEDKGYYQVDYSYAQDDNMVFGKNRGCDFVTKKCNDPLLMGAGLEFCSDQTPDHMYCSTDYLARGQCGVTTWATTLASYWQYFSNPSVGGAVELPDFCPTGVGYSNMVCIDSTASDTQNIYGNTYGSASRCFQSNLIQRGFSSNDATIETRCFPVSCTSAGRIVIDVQGQVALCPSDGSAGPADVSAVTSFVGSIICPRAIALCRDPNAATPTPVVAAPTPQPTPAPPGQTPAPAPVVRPPTTPAPALPTSCADRWVCANALSMRLPWCRPFADALIACFGRTCDAELAKWLAQNQAVCTDSFIWGNANCVEGPLGGAAMCSLLNVA